MTENTLKEVKTILANLRTKVKERKNLRCTQPMETLNVNDDCEKLTSDVLKNLMP